MGMAASQATLLGLTTRMHDLTLKAQNIERYKLDLALDQDEAYKKYCDAMDATKIQIGRKNAATGGVSYIDACFDTVCGFQPLNCTQYSLVNSQNGRVIVTPEIKEIYNQNRHDKYTFAWAAMGYDEQFGWDTLGPWGSCTTDGHKFIGIESNVNYGIENADFPLTLPAGSPPAGFGTDLYMSEAEYLVFCAHYEQGGNDPLNVAYENLLDASRNGASISERKKLLAEFRSQLYKYPQEILNAMNMPKNEAPGDPTEIPTNIPDEFSDNMNWSYMRTQFLYYEELWEQITEAGGCEEIDSMYTSGQEGIDWFNAMVTSGRVHIYTLDLEKDKGWELTTIASADNNMQEVSDEEAAKKAETEYQYELNKIKVKDNRYDMELKKLETEKQACEKAIETSKQARNDNINRAFDQSG